MTLSKEINLLVLAGMVTLGVLFSTISVYTIHKNSKTEMTHLSTLIKSERNNKLRDLVYSAYSVLETANFYEPAQAALSRMRFGEEKKNYFLVVDTDGMIWVNPANPAAVGEVKLEATDADGMPYVRKIIDEALVNGEGFINYKEIPEGRTSPVTRMAYYKHFREWDWIVCAGMYMDDIQNLLDRKQNEIKHEMINRVILIMALVAVTVLLGTMAGTYIISRRIVNPLVSISEAAQKIGVGDFTNKLEVKSSKEINRLAESVILMQNSLEIALRRANQRVRQKQVKSVWQRPHDLAN